MKRFNQTITSLLIKHKIDLLVVSFLSLFLPLFLYNLGSYSLVDFDEAWFAEVALNILKRGNPLVLTFNGLSFNEHPPLGFILMAISFVLFGVNEFAARLPEALSAFFSLLLLYFIGKELFNRAIGLGASLILAGRGFSDVLPADFLYCNQTQIPPAASHSLSFFAGSCFAD